MFKTILDHSLLEGLIDIYRKHNIDRTEFTPACYAYLKNYSRPIVSSIFGKYYPVKMLVTIRTDYTNEVVVPKDARFYVDCTFEDEMQRPFEDTVMLSAKKFVDKYFDCGEHLPQVMSRTAPLPLGAVFLGGAVYVYTNIVIDHKLKQEDFFKLKDCDFVPISSLSSSSVLEFSLLKKLPILPSKEVDTNVSNDNQG